MEIRVNKQLNRLLLLLFSGIAEVMRSMSSRESESEKKMRAKYKVTTFSLASHLFGAPDEWRWRAMAWETRILFFFAAISVFG